MNYNIQYVPMQPSTYVGTVKPYAGTKTWLLCCATGFWPILCCPVDYPSNVTFITPKKAPKVLDSHSYTGAAKLNF